MVFVPISGCGRACSWLAQPFTLYFDFYHPLPIRPLSSFSRDYQWMPLLTFSSSSFFDLNFTLPSPSSSTHFSPSTDVLLSIQCLGFFSNRSSSPAKLWPKLFTSECSNGSSSASIDPLTGILRRFQSSTAFEPLLNCFCPSSLSSYTYPSISC